MAIVTMFSISMSLVIFCLLFSFVNYVPDLHFERMVLTEAYVRRLVRWLLPKAGER